MEVYRILRNYRVYIITVGHQNTWYSTILHKSNSGLPFIMLSNSLNIVSRVVKLTSMAYYYYLLSDLDKKRGYIKSVVDNIE